MRKSKRKQTDRSRRSRERGRERERERETNFREVTVGAINKSANKNFHVKLIKALGSRSSEARSLTASIYETAYFGGHSTPRYVYSIRRQKKCAY